MKISSIQLKETVCGLKPFKKINAGNIVVVTGSNGSGKTRLLKLLEQYIDELHKGIESTYLDIEISDSEAKEVLSINNASKIRIANYSHFDAQLQSPQNFTPYVICKAKEILRTCNYEETALNSLLLLEDMANGYSNEYKDGIQFEKITNFLYELSGISIEVDQNSKHLKISGLEENKSALSPGQQYLLRIAIACYCNEVDNSWVFLLDEPELHLHPQALIKLIGILRHKFPNTQFWISTHSLALISYITVIEKNATILYMEDGAVDILRSNSSKLLNGLIGADENLFSIQQLLALPDEYACNKFAVECCYPPDTVEASGNDPQTQLIETILHEGDVVVDYGVGKGRFFEELSLSGCNNIASKIQYYAYDKFTDDADVCKEIMNRLGSTEKNYFNNYNELLSAVKGKADYVLLINVLHEIPPEEWTSMFEAIKELLNDTGKLVIVEREELTIGESPYNNGFLMLTKNGAKKLFGRKTQYTKHDKKNYIVKYTVNKDQLNISNNQIIQCIKEIKNDAFSEIKSIKNCDAVLNNQERYRLGIKLAFYLQQYATATIIIEETKRQAKKQIS